MSQFNQHFITLIIDRYGLEFEDERIESIVTTWIGQYDRAWIVKAIVESVHRGRYKIKSVDSILCGWQRTGKPSYNFPPEFEREMLQDLPTMDDLAETQPSPALSPLDDLDPPIPFPGLSSEQLNPEESAPFPHHDCCRNDANPFSSLRDASAEADASRTRTRRSANGKAAPRQDRRQSIRATPSLQPPTIDRGKTLPPAEIVEAYLQDNRPFSLKPPSVVSFNGEDEHLNPHQIISHPKFQLFHTLRAIITPNNLPAIKPDDLDPPSYSTDLA